MLQPPPLFLPPPIARRADLKRAPWTPPHRIHIPLIALRALRRMHRHNPKQRF